MCVWGGEGDMYTNVKVSSLQSVTFNILQNNIGSKFKCVLCLDNSLENAKKIINNSLSYTHTK